jgi:hypothetical protein
MHLPLLLASPFVVASTAFAVRILAMGMTCAVLIWIKNRS